MINFIKEQIAIRRFKRDLREYTRPNRAFLESARSKFLILAYPQKRVVSTGRKLNFFRYATAAMMVMLFMISGMAVYAEKNDVSATHMLYPVKRFSETVRIGISFPAKKLELSEALARRRLGEIIKLKKEEDVALGLLKNDKSTPSPEIAIASLPVPTEKPAIKNVAPQLTPQQKIIRRLNYDFEKQARVVLDIAEKLPAKEGDHIRICKEINSAIHGGPASSSSRFVSEVEIRCDKVLQKDKTLNLDRAKNRNN